MACMYLLQRAALKGVSAEAILDDMQLPVDFFDTASNSSTAQVLPQVLLSGIRLTADRQFGFEAAKQLHPCLLGSCGLAATHAPTLSVMLDSFAEFGNQLATWYQIDSQSVSGQTTWTLHLGESCDEPAAEYLAIAWATAMTAFGRLAIGEEFVAERISFIQGLPHEAELLQDYFRCPLDYGAESNQLAIPSGFLQKKSRLFDAILFDQLSFAASALKRQMTSSSITDAVDQAIRLGSFDLPDIARALGMTERTVQRRLKDEGTTFQHRLDTVRLGMADTYLCLPSLTVEEIAIRLGFSSDKAFRNAYRRWTGRSPRGGHET